ncbi:MAG TPA: hypothetical protein PK179_10385 [Spirochaetales bacterium]|nr:hypothetical protein [Spirochaetales bacterium]
MSSTRCRPYIVALFALAALAPAMAQAPATVAMSDFVVNSDNPAFTYLGKGFAEIIAFEVRKAPQVRLVDREQRNKQLEEMEFSLSGLTDPSAQLEIGKLLSVRFLVSGSITDMGGPLLVSLSMLDVQTGAIVWNDQLTATSGKYAYIGAYFGKSLLRHFNATVSKETERALVASKDGDEASVIALSRGIEALDKGDTDEAKKQLTAARSIDPDNQVAAALLSKLASASAKFKVVPERSVSYYNPAYLGGMEKDKAYFNLSFANLAWGLPNEDKGESQDYWLALDESGDYGTSERQMNLVAGYGFPLNGVLGLCAEVSGGGELSNAILRQYAPGDWMASGNDYTYYISGGSITAGLRVSPWLSLGLGATVSYKKRDYYSEYLGSPPPELADPMNGYWLDTGISFGGMLAAALRSRSGGLSWDVSASWSNEVLHYFDTDPAALEFYEYGAPLYVEQTLSWSPAGQKTFLALKQVNDLYFDRELYYSRLMPCVEQWFFGLFAVRLGVEGSIVYRDNLTELGWGATAGVTIPVWKLELDANYTLRQRPSRSLPGVTIPENVFFITVSADGLLFGD